MICFYYFTWHGIRFKIYSAQTRSYASSLLFFSSNPLLTLCIKISTRYHLSQKLKLRHSSRFWILVTYEKHRSNCERPFLWLPWKEHFWGWQSGLPLLLVVWVLMFVNSQINVDYHYIFLLVEPNHLGEAIINDASLVIFCIMISSVQL